MASTSAETLDITIEFGGGTEFLTSTKKTKKHVLQIPRQIADQDDSISRAIGSAEEANAVVAPAAAAAASSGDIKTKKQHPASMRDLVRIVLEKLITERHSMLIEPDGSIRPGIMVLINDADWELEGEMEYELQDDDHVCFISTLHGG